MFRLIQNFQLSFFGGPHISVHVISLNADVMYFNLFISRRFSNLTQTHFSPSVHSKIKTLVQQGLYLESLKSYTIEPNFPLSATKFTFPSLLKACASLPNLHYGKTIHSTIITMGLQFDPFIATSLINVYVKCGSLSNAVQVFVNLSDSEVLARDVTLWNSLIDGYFRYGFLEEGLTQFRRMQALGVKPDGYSLSIVIAVCGGVSGCLEGKKIHGYVVRNMFDGDPFLMTALVDMYSSCGRPREAWLLFEKSEDKENVVAWNAMIGGFRDNGWWENSLELYSLMKNENCKIVSATFSSTLSACSQGEDVRFGGQVHCDVIKMDFQDDPYVCTSLLTMYAKCGSFEDTKEVFDSIPNKEVELWNAMIAACVGNGYAYYALDIYNQMKFNELSFDSFTMSNLLASCTMLGLYDLGRALHGEMIKTPMQASVHVQSALLTMYSKCGKMEDAKAVYSVMNEKDVVAWGSLISGFCQNNKLYEVLDLFKAMVEDGLKPDSDIIASVIAACVGLNNIELGHMVHGFVIKSGLGLDSFVASSLINMYSKHGSPEMAKRVSFELPKQILAVWNSMISCYNQNGLPELSISLLPQLVHHGLYPDSVSITSVLSAVSSMAALLKGKIIHGYSIRLEVPFDAQVENALIDMYIKCGCLKYAHNIFQNMSQRNLVTWNSVISGYGSHGECIKAIGLFNEMRRLGFKPDDVTFLSLVSSCNHSGLLNEGLGLFQLMKDFKIEPRMEHYVNIVDLMGRAGRLKDAYSFIKNMPIEADRSVWLCLLSACRAHQNVELGEVAGNKLLEIEPTRGSNYVQLLNLYVEGGLKEKAANLRGLMRQKGLKKIPGCSWIEVKNKVDMFFSGDSSSPRTVEIYETLKSLGNNMGKRGGSHEGVEAF